MKSKFISGFMDGLAGASLFSTKVVESISNTDTDYSKMFNDRSILETIGDDFESIG